MSGVETIPALSSAMERRISLLNSSVELMEKLHERLTKGDTNKMSMELALDLYKTMSHQFTEVLEACRRCSADELVGRLDNLHLYQLISNMTVDEKTRLREYITKMSSDKKSLEVIVLEPVYTPVVTTPPVTPVSE